MKDPVAVILRQMFKWHINKKEVFKISMIRIVIFPSSLIEKLVPSLILRMVKDSIKIQMIHGNIRLQVLIV